MFDFLHQLKDKIFTSRTSIILTVFIIFSSILVLRLFVLQIVRGSDYQNNYDMLVEKKETIDANRGNIYDRKGNLLAYNKLAYAVTIEDNGSYDSKEEKNKILNHQLYLIISNIEKRGNAIDNDFSIYINSAGEFEFSKTGTSLQRFRADVFGYASINDLTYNKKLGFDEAKATPNQIMKYLYSDDRYGISNKYSAQMRYKIGVIRYAMSGNSYQKYIATTIASDINDESLAYIKENSADFVGVDIAEKSIREYVDSQCFSNIIGYTGKISTEEYDKLKKNSDEYTLNDVIGKSGIEKVMNSSLSGTKGTKTVYVDNVGNPIKTTDEVAAVSGGDVYLSIDKDLQVATYKLLEQELAGILSSKIANIKEYNTSEDSDSDILIPIYEVYFALVNNELIDTDALNTTDSTPLEKEVYQSYESKQSMVLNELETQLTAEKPTAYKDLDGEYQDYFTFIIKMLKSEGILNNDAIDTSDPMQVKWSAEQLSVKEYLTYAIEQNWIDITSYTSESKYSNSDELYQSLVSYILSDLTNNHNFSKQIYHYAILQDMIRGNQLCAILYDQGVLAADDTTRNALANGSMSAYGFMLDKIKKLEITPGQLALDPCSASCVIMDTNSGDVLACVSYPGYDTNKLANTVDSSYYGYLNSSLSSPLYNHATQQETAPGSTFKLVTSTAGLAEGVIDTSTIITDLGEFDKVSNKPHCWIYPSTHGSINLSEAIRDSCNYFFYEVGYRLAGSTNYSDKRGINLITKYASLYGLNDKTGIEIDENTPHIATEYPVMAAIGQSDNNYTTISLARYVTAVANSGSVYNLSLLDHSTSQSGSLDKTYGPSIKNKIDVLNTSQWSSIHSGMRMVVESLATFDNFPIAVAGKTGTAQESKSRPNHSLFIGYAPYDNPSVAIATRIPFGYTSHNAADVSKNILGVYFNLDEYKSMVDAGAANVSSGNAVVD